MRFPWTKREKREDVTSSTTYSDLRLAAVLAAATGESGAEIGAVAAAEVAAGLWGRSFAGAAVVGTGAAVAGLSPDILESIGRSLVLRGESLFVIDVQKGALSLVPVATWDVRGEWRPETWRYECEIAGPDDTWTVLAPAEQVIHVRYATAPAQPWRGISPLASSRLTSNLAAMLETRLGQEASAAVATLIPIPEGTTPEQTETLRDSLANLRGKLALVPSAAGGWGAGDRAARSIGWSTTRLGADPPETLASLRMDSAKHVLAAAGVPVELFEAGEGTASREAFRRFLHATLAPVARIAERELSEKLETPIGLNFDALYAADIQGRARAFQSLVGGGMDIAKAAAVTGVLAED